MGKMVRVKQPDGTYRVVPAGQAGDAEIVPGFDLFGGIGDWFGGLFEPTEQVATTETATTLPDWQEPALQEVVHEATDWYESAPDTHPELSPETEEALTAQWDIAKNNPYVNWMLYGSPTPPVDESGQPIPGGGLSGLINYQNPTTGMYDPLLGGYQDIIQSRNPYTGAIKGLDMYDPSGRGIPGIIEGAMRNPGGGLALGAAGMRNIGRDYLTSLIGSGRDVETEDLYRDIARGSMMGGNPYLDAMFDRASGKISDRFTQDIIPGVTSQFARSGRYGSAAHQRALDRATEQAGDALTDLGTGLYGGAYGLERGLLQDAIGGLGGTIAGGKGRELGLGGQLSTTAQDAINNYLRASGLISGDYATGVGQQLQGTGLLSSINQGNIGRQLDKYGLLSNIYQGDIGNILSGLAGYGTGISNLGGTYDREAGIQGGAIGMLPGIRSMQTGDVSLLRDVGGARDVWGQGEAVETPTEIGMYRDLVAGNYGGTTSGTTTSPGPSPWDTTMNTLGQIGTIASPFVMPGGMMNPYPTTGGAMPYNPNTAGYSGYGGNPYQYGYSGYVSPYGGY